MKRTSRRQKPTPITFSRQVGLVNQTGQGNNQTVNLKLVQQLRLCQANCESLKRELALCQELVAAKDETIRILQGGG
ncbi:hypothetical protein JAO73_10635 [Hymenobacter sp. BT523]|uniref:hypothetical protein n=1 Tax=Hymenobacter sp. BT523 TaxID=2795725 RepID=UPI0018EB08D8|nr:hypothetical protein [Hymenobacter sp. BT523]MBJ6109472.1 hypothetical protein [Hymenobacter sp. BT523]